MIDSEFYNDSSSALGMGHSATRAEETTKCDACEAIVRADEMGGHICQPHFNVLQNPLLKDERWLEHNNRKLRAEAMARGEELPEPTSEVIVPTNAGAYDKIEERIGELVAAGLTLLDATILARRETTTVDRQIEPTIPEKADYLGASIGTLMGIGRSPHLGGGSGNKDVIRKTKDGYTQTQLMGAKSAGGGGGKGRRVKDARKGTWVCAICHLEYCGHRAMKRGRPPKEATVRDVEVDVGMTQQTRASIARMGVNASDALAIVGIAYREGRLVDEVLDEWLMQHGQAKAS